MFTKLESWVVEYTPSLPTCSPFDLAHVPIPNQAIQQPCGYSHLSLERTRVGDPTIWQTWSDVDKLWSHTKHNQRLPWDQHFKPLIPLPNGSCALDGVMLNPQQIKFPEVPKQQYHQRISKRCDTGTTWRMVWVALTLFTLNWGALLVGPGFSGDKAGDGPFGIKTRVSVRVGEVWELATVVGVDEASFGTSYSVQFNDNRRFPSTVPGIREGDMQERLRGVARVDSEKHVFNASSDKRDALRRGVLPDAVQNSIRGWSAKSYKAGVAASGDSHVLRTSTPFVTPLAKKVVQIRGKNTLVVVSLNIFNVAGAGEMQGLGTGKLVLLGEHFHLEQVDVILLQEVKHMTSKPHFGSHYVTYFSQGVALGSNYHQGVAIMVRNEFTNKNISFPPVCLSSRCMWIGLQINSIKFCVMNIYAPASSSENYGNLDGSITKSFLDTVGGCIKLLPPKYKENMIVGGDWNARPGTGSGGMDDDLRDIRGSKNTDSAPPNQAGMHLIEFDTLLSHREHLF